ncbi:MAG TPA: hypothetical protein VIQ30_08555 [Pseudonocardia sp.]
MALLTATRPTISGVAWSPAAVSSSDTIAAADLGVNGALLYINNGGASPDTVTVTDPGTTPAGSVATNPTNSVTNGTAEVMRISPNFVNPSTGVATVSHSFTTSVTYVLIPLG